MEIERLNLSIPETGRTLGCCRSLTYKLINEKELETIKIGRRRLVPVASIRAYVERKMNEAAK